MSERAVFRFMIAVALAALVTTGFIRLVGPDAMPEFAAVLLVMFWGLCLIAMVLSAALVVAINAAKLMGRWDAD